MPDAAGVGQIDAMSAAMRVRDAARRAMADPLIEGLPGGCDQLIGRRFKTGVDLSGGQWQKIAWAVCHGIRRLPRRPGSNRHPTTQATAGYTADRSAGEDRDDWACRHSHSGGRRIKIGPMSPSHLIP